MEKQFIVNNRKIATVECGISTDVCPVVKLLSEHKTGVNDSEPCSVCGPMDTGRTFVVALTKNVRALNRSIMEICMNCDVKCR